MWGLPDIIGSWGWSVWWGVVDGAISVLEDAIGGVWSRVYWVMGLSVVRARSGVANVGKSRVWRMM